MNIASYNTKLSTNDALAIRSSGIATSDFILLCGTAFPRPSRCL